MFDVRCYVKFEDLEVFVMKSTRGLGGCMRSSHISEKLADPVFGRVYKPPFVQRE